MVADPAMAPANDDRRFVTPLGELIATLADEADAICETEAEADELVVASMFGLQWSLRRAILATDAEVEDSASGRAA